MRQLAYTLMGFSMLVPSLLLARPVSYPGGWTSMVMNSGLGNSVHIHYSPSAKISLGYKYAYFKNADFSFNGLQINQLLHRLNKKNSQGNVYLKSGLGSATHKSNSRTAVFTGIAADWETRRVFTSYETRYTAATNIDSVYRQTARVGLAPYMGDYGDIHTWVMLQVDHMPDAQHPVTLTPLIRLFKGINLIEIGVNNRNEVLLNYVSRF